MPSGLTRPVSLIAPGKKAVLSVMAKVTKKAQRGENRRPSGKYSGKKQMSKKTPGT
jgi:hypothetical protein